MNPRGTRVLAINPAPVGGGRRARLDALEFGEPASIRPFFARVPDISGIEFGIEVQRPTIGSCDQDLSALERFRGFEDAQQRLRRFEPAGIEFR
jgi:hypothetical protein